MSATAQAARAPTACAERYPPVADYAIIGDCHTAALVSREGSIDWYCPGRFDGPAVFCRLLDANKGGHLSLAPPGRFASERRYRGATNVLETTFTADGGRARVTDFMPIFRRAGIRAGQDVGTSRQLIRLVEGLGGEMELELRFKPTFDYARARTELSPSSNGAVAHGDGQYLTLACPGLRLEPDGAGGLRGRLRISAGERRPVVLSDVDDPGQARDVFEPSRCDEQLERTLEYWEDWTTGCSLQTPYRPQVLRSALTLRLLTYQPTGAIIAAPTTSLPEQLGGVRNWDYRYTWLRDACLTLYALMTLGYRDEAADFFAWLDRVCGSEARESFQIMYTIDGKSELPERTLDELEGYACSRPVRIGNAAAKQRQLDIFGEVLTAAYLHYRRGGREGRTATARPDRSPSPEMWAFLRRLVEQAAEQWREPGQGIWEVRGGPRQFLYGKLMCWAAVDRGIRLAEEHRLEAPLDRWRRACQEIHRAILEQGFDPERGAFTQAFGSTALDAGALIIPRIGFLPATDPRVQSTIDRIKVDLTHDGLVYRYRTADGLPGGEATFALCSFWLVDALALGGRLDEAHELFERVSRYANDVGLLAEEIDPARGELLGNFPQGFSHLALIGSAVNLAKAAKHGAEEDSTNEAERAGHAHRAAAEGHAHRPGAGAA